MSETAIPAARTHPLNVIFAGVPDLAVPALRALADSQHDVALVVTQPDRPAGRGRKLKAPPVKSFAESRGIPVIQPESINRPDAVEAVRVVRPDTIVSFAYGRRFARRVLRLPRLGCFNIHASLLPRYRGAAPIQHAILNGDAETGVTVQRMAEEIDTGPVLALESLRIGPDETAGELAERIGELAACIIVPTLDGIERGEIEGSPQDESLACDAPALRKKDGLVPWHRDADRVRDFVRAMTPWPGAYTFHCGADGRCRVRLTLLSVRIVAEPGPVVARTFGSAAPPGTVISAQDRLLVAAGDRFVEVCRVKPAGGKAMDAASFLRGHDIRAGDRFQ